MSEQVPFYNIETSKLVIELKPRIKHDYESLHCAHVTLDKHGKPRACRVDGFEDHYECAICGAFYCNQHISEQILNVAQGNDLAICLACSKLNKDTRMTIRAFRLEINR